ncbi:peptidoglycan DD-metalloendopeptidase family protein [Photobacterium carnosum]|uniref:peptidoglycan DD-metalloendopeptidase family protein n=1 Tax=Photobacterium carnosum TaxID=2023717 RepID=UPI001E32B230|nr:peptidoglycan DD-metalloendopeptidase family protein [Photobacterium carnosum]MCD9530619.1 peptidoglycan DD-metalloendopeptidase family protein [Photobacterium carnosum]MCF2155062.1 peptidoglycan DD-metalloendopeptidase family protein [Photobacterium carnosum]MCF2216464.1 peptidoglycan DD-metalloendopeptidase family protein [Photobacterium carnosum]
MSIERMIKKIIQPSLLAVTCVVLLSACSSHTPAPVSNLAKDYSQLQRGSFHGSYYTVQKGDTLYFISYMTGRDVKDIVKLNRLPYPYTIYPGQRLAIPTADSQGRTNNVVVMPIIAPSAAKTVTQTVHKPAIKKPIVQKTTNKPVAKQEAKEYSEKTKVNKPVTNKPVTKPTSHVSSSGWAWPVKGKIIEGFSNADNGNKGIDITAARGTPIRATSAGKVVYAGDALRGYGNLVIIKHSEDYLSAYAHNDKILVKEQQSVKAGQEIATMGSSGASSVRLHFEIRYKGKSVDPMRFLPK